MARERLHIRRINKEIVDYKNQKNFEKYSKKYCEIFNKLRLSLYAIKAHESDDEDYYLDILDGLSKYQDSVDRDNCVIVLKIPTNYPFKPYQITYYNKTDANKLSYHKYMIDISQTTKNKNLDILILFYKILYGSTPKFLLLSKNDCYCCSSITCGNNWYPSHTVADLLHEYYEIEFIKHYCKKENYKLLVKTHNYLFKTLFAKLPDEIIEEILNVYTL